MKILVFGSTGALGTAMKKICKKRNVDFVGLSHSDFEISDKKTLEYLIKKNNPDVIINSVAIIGNQCDIDPKRAFDINSLPALNLSKICNKKGIVFIQPSTHAVFDGKKNGKYDESDKPNPLNFYGLSKYTAELFTNDNCEKRYIVRFPTMFGPRENSSLGFVDKVLKKINLNEEIKIADDKIDSPTYTFDAADQLISLVQQDFPYGIYHVANSGKVSYYDIVAKIFEFYGKDKSKLIRAKDSDFPSLCPKPLKTSICSTKIKPLRSWEEALEDYLKN